MKNKNKINYLFEETFKTMSSIEFYRDITFPDGKVNVNYIMKNSVFQVKGGSIAETLVEYHKKLLNRSYDVSIDSIAANQTFHYLVRIVNSGNRTRIVDVSKSHIGQKKKAFMVDLIDDEVVKSHYVADGTSLRSAFLRMISLLEIE